MNKNEDKNYDNLDILIENDIRNDFPSELDCLSTHTYIESVDDITIESEKIKDGIATLEGNGTIYLELQYNSDYDNKNGDGLIHSIDFDFSFKIELDINKNAIITSEYEFDTEKFYS